MLLDVRRSCETTTSFVSLDHRSVRLNTNHTGRENNHGGGRLQLGCIIYDYRPTILLEV